MAWLYKAIGDWPASTKRTNHNLVYKPLLFLPGRSEVCCIVPSKSLVLQA